jgi:SPP1 family predicted phage head-tail adaptor
MGLRTGSLRYRVHLEQLVAGSPQQKPTGEPDLAWTEVETVWADIRPLRGEALFRAQQVNSRVSVEIDIRYRDDITSGMRVVHGATIYDIESVPPLRPVHGGRFTLSCSTGLNQG